MARPRVFIFDDGYGDFGPLTDLRPSFSCAPGPSTTRERIAHWWPRKQILHVPAPLAALTVERTGESTNQRASGDRVLVVNGRYLAVDPPAWVLRPGQSDHAGRALVQADRQLVLALLPAAKANALIGSWNAARLPGLKIDRLASDVLIERPWDILARIEATIAFDLTLFNHLPRRRRLAKAFIGPASIPSGFIPAPASIRARS